MTRKDKSTIIIFSCLFISVAFSQENDGICRDIKRPPVALYPFQRTTEGKNVYPKDYTSDGELHQTSFTTDIDGIEGNAISIDGSQNSYVKIPRLSDVASEKDITIVLSVKPTGSEGEIFTFKSGNVGVRIFQRTSTKEGYSKISVDFASRRQTFSKKIEADVLALNKWNIIATSYNYSSGEAKLYKDGELVQNLFIGSHRIANHYGIRLGSLEYVDNGLQGDLSCLQIYTFPLGLEEVKQSMYACRKASTILNTKVTVQKKEFTEPFDDVVLHVEEPITDVNIYIDFGDGSKELYTRDRKVTHQYKSIGIYTVNMEFCLGCRSNKILKTIKIPVYMYVEKPAQLEIESIITKLGDLSHLEAYLEKGSHFNCTWDFGDLTGQVETFHGESKQMKISHNYTKAGIFLGSVQCYNRKANLKASFQATIQDSIEALEIEDIPYQLITQNFKVSWKIGKGSTPKYRVIVNEQLNGYRTLNDGLIAEATINPKIFKGEHGVYNITVGVENDVTESITAFKSFVVYPEIIQISVESERVIYEVNETINLIAHSENKMFRRSPLFDWDFGDGSQTLKHTNHTTHKYIMYGKKQIQVTAYNPVHKKLNILELEILRPVVHLKELDCKADTVSVQEASVVKCNMGLGSDFKCGIDWHGFQTNEKTLTSYKFYINQSVSLDHLKNIEFEDHYTFKDAGHYQLTITCNNRLSKVKKQILVVVQEVITGLNIDKVDPQRFGNEFRVSWHLQTGTDVVYLIYWNEKLLGETFELHNGKPSIVVTKEIYERPGFHTFTLKTFNNVTEEVVESINIIVEYAIVSFDFQIQTKNGFLEVGENMTVTYLHTNATDVMYTVRYSDGGKVTSPDNKHIKSFESYGKFDVHVTAYNNISRIEIKKEVTVLKPVLKLGELKLSEPKENVSESTTFIARLSVGSDFRCTLDYGDGSQHNTSEMYDSYFKTEKDRLLRFFKGLVLKFDHSYTNPQEYTVKIHCVNRLSEAIATSKVYIYRPVVAFKIKMPVKIEQNDPVSFEISNENQIEYTKHKFTVNYGDGALLYTKDNKVTHTYSEFGEYQLKITAENPVSKITITKTVQILKTVIPLKGISVSSTPVNVTDPTVVKISIEEGSDFNCTIRWTKKVIKEINMMSLRYLEGDDMKGYRDIKIREQFVFKNKGRYSVTISCFNRLNRLTIDKDVIVQEPLGGFFLVPTLPQVFGTEFHINFIVESGSDLNLNFIFNNKEIPVNSSENKILITSDLYSHPGTYKYSMSGSNLVTSTITREGEVIIDEEVKNFQLSIVDDKNIVEVNETIKFKTKLSKGSKVLYSTDYGNGVKFTELRDGSFQYAYSMYGTYEITVSAYNNVSKLSAKITVTVQKPVLPLVSLKIDTVSQMNISTPYAIHLLLNEGSDFRCQIDFGDDNKFDTLALYTAFYTTKPRSDKSEYQNLDITMNHVYTKPGKYQIKANCSNRISREEAEMEIEIHIPLTAFLVIASKSTFEINETVNFQIKDIDPESKPDFHITGGEYTPKQILNEFQFKSSFSHHGEFKVQVHASNPTSQQVASILVTVLKPVLQLQNLTLFARPTNLTSETVLHLMLQKGSDFSCAVKWNEKSDYTKEIAFEKYTFYTERSLDETPFKNIQLSIPHTYEAIGVHKITVKCSNRKGTVKKQTTVDVQIPIDGFELQDVTPKRVGYSFKVNWLINNGSNIDYTIQWKNEFLEYQRLNDKQSYAVVSMENYKKAGIFSYKVTARNKVSHAGQRIGHVILEDQIEDFELNLRNPKVEYEVNETINAYVTMSSGSNPHFEYNKGDDSKSIHHTFTTFDFSYIKQGEYTFKVIGRNNVSKLEVDQEIKIKKPVLKITKVSIDLKPAYKLNEEIEIVATVESGSDLKCFIVYGDGSQDSTVEVINQHYYKNGRKENLEDFRNFTVPFKHTYTEVENYEISVTCHNRLSSKTTAGRITIEDVLPDIYIDTISYKKVGEDFMVEFNVPVDSIIMYNIEFQGKNYPMTGQGNKKETLKLKSEKRGIYTIYINATNFVTGTITKSTQVIIEQPIISLKITDPPMNAAFEVGEDFKLCYSIEDGSNPHYDLILGNKEMNDLQEVCLHHKFPFNKNFTSGIANVSLPLKVTARNNVSNVQTMIHVILMKPIIDVKYISMKCLPAITGEVSHLSLDLSGSDFTCSWIMEKKGKTTYEMSDIFHKNENLDVTNFKNMTKKHEEIYSKPDAYVAIVYCANRRSNFTRSTTCYVQDSISDITIDPIKAKLLGSSPIISWTEASGTNVTYRMIFENTNDIPVHMNNTKSYAVIPKELAKREGYYHGKIIASNLVTQNFTKPFIMKFEKDLRIDDVTIAYNNKYWGEIEGHGARSNYFPVGKNITFDIETNTDDFVAYWEIYYYGKLEANMTQRNFVYNFKEYGDRLVKYRVTNNISSVVGEREITLIQQVGYLQLTSNSPQAVGDKINFTIIMPAKGQETCFKLDTGDSNTYYYTTEKGDCSIYYPNKTIKISGIFPKHENSLLISHSYKNWSFYRATITATNHLSNVSDSHIVLASEVKCKYPIINITNLGDKPFQATRLAKSEKMTVYIDNQINCQYTSKAKYEWKIYKYNTENGKMATAEFDQSKYNFNPYVMKDFIIKKKALDYGIYLFKVTVTMDDPKTMIFNTSMRGYLHVYPTPIIGAVEGGALIRRGMGKILPLNGGASYDPDIGKKRLEGMNFTWICFNAMEEPPKELNNSEYELPKYNVAILNPLPYDKDVVKDGGCFGNGTYFFETKDEIFGLDTSKMIPEQVYVIIVLVRKDRRTSIGFQVLELVKGLPPELGIECAENCMDKINPSGKLALMGTCKGEVCSQDIKYEWEVYKVKSISADGKITWELDQEVMVAVEQYRKELVFVIKKFILTPGKLYRFTLIGGLDDGPKGLAQRNGLTNTPPKNGKCYAEQEEGEAMETLFTFNCEDWDDEDIPLRYEYVYFNSEGGESLFFFGVSSSASGKLPLGDEKTNFTTRMEIRIIDVFDATAKVTLYVKVVEPKLTEDEMIEKLLNMTQGENSELEKIVNSGDTQAIAKLMNSVSSVLNKNSDTAGKRKKKRTQMLKDLSVNGTLHVNGSVLFQNGTVLHNNATAVLVNGTVVQKNGTVFHPNGTTHDNGTWLFGNNTGLNITELTEEQKRQRDREAIRTALIVALSNQKSTSLEAIRQNADVMASLTKSKGEVTAKSQESSAGSLMGMANSVSGESSSEDGAGSDAIEGTAGTMASGLGNLIGSAAGSAKAKIVPKPTTTPAPTTTVSILGFEMLFDMDEEEEVIVSDDDEDYVETDPTKLKAQETVAGVFSAAGKVGGSMTGKKLPGEESTVIDSPSMAMASGQVDPKKMGAPVCSPKGAGFKMPKNGNLFKNAGNDTEMNAVGQQMMSLNDNPFSWDPKGGVSGAVTSVTLGSGSGGAMNVSETEEPIEVTMPREGDPEPPTLITFPPLTQKYVYHKVEIEKNNTALTAHIIPQDYSEPPFNGSVMLGIYVRRNFRPTKEMTDWTMIFPKETNETYDPCNPPPPEVNYTLFISDKYLSKGVYWIGVSYLAPPGMSEDALVNVTLNYTLRIFTSQCKYWSEEKNKWMTDGCHVGPKTDLTKTHCLCNHLTSFGGGMITAPAPIDFSKVFAGFKDMFASGNVGVFFTIIGMFGLYIILAVHSRRMDKKEEAQMGVTPIFNANHPDANYQYELTFITNRGSKSGTSANVFCNIVGTKGESGPIALKDTERVIFIPSAVNSFLILVPECLGEIKYIRLWHDNSGYYPSWNLRKINMKDLKTNDTWIFLGSWLALDEGDFEIDKTIPPATEADLADFKLLFQEKLMQDLGDAHIWFSIFMRPPTSRFTRLQRLSSCLTILCLTMVSSAMFYGAGPASAADDANAIAIGPITVSLKMIIIGIQSSIVVVPPTLLIVYLFSSARRRNAITIEGSLKKARERKEREENGLDEEVVSSCCCFKRKRKKSKLNCFRCCRREESSESESDFDSFDDFDSICEDTTTGRSSRTSRRSKSSRRSMVIERKRKTRIRGYYESSSDSAESDETYVSSSDEEDTSVESEPEPILNMEEINEMERDASKIMIDDEEEKEEKPNFIEKIIQRFTKKKELTAEEKLEQERKEVEALEKQIHGSLPWWVIYPAWVLVFLGSTTPALFTLFYSMMWGKTKSNAWLTTQALSFFQDTFVSRPVKIIIITTLVAFLLKKKPRGNKYEEQPAAEPLQEGEEPITSGLENENKDDVIAMCKPPNAKLVAQIREMKLKEKRMSEILWEMALFMIYLLLLFMVSAGNRDIRAYKQRAVIDTMLIKGGSKYSPMYKIDNVNNVDSFWKYVNQTFIPAVYYNTWYNGDIYNYTGFSAFRETKRLGITRLRQLRVKNNTCTIHPEFKSYIPQCNDKYSASNGENRWFKKTWTNPVERSGKQKKRFSPWKYATGMESRNIIPIMATLNTYPGGGFLGELGINEEFSQMYKNYMIKYRWVDKYTRAVFLEFTLYNANLNLISVGTIMFEFFNFGGALPRAEIYVSRLYRSLVPEHKVFLIFDIIFFFYVFYCLFREARKWKRTGKSYFKSVDNLTNAFCVFLGIATMGTYAIRALSLGSKIDEYNKNPDLFISFYQNAMYHEMVAVLMSLIDFIAIIKFLMFLQFNRNFLMLIQTVIRAAPRISWFMLYLSIQVFAFVAFSYLLFGSERYNFSSLQRSVYSMNLLLLGVFDWEDFMSRPKSGPFLFLAYCIVMTFMLMNIFLTILMEIYALVQEDEELAKREFKLVEYLMDSMKLSLGLKKPLGIGDEELPMRKKDPYIHRLNRTTRSIETRKTPKINKLINKAYLDDFIEDIEILCLEMMRYSDEFHDLVPCSYKVKLQMMLQRGEITYETFCEFMNIPLEDRDSLSGQSIDSISLDSNSMKFLHEEIDRISEETEFENSELEKVKYTSINNTNDKDKINSNNTNSENNSTDSEQLQNNLNVKNTEKERFISQHAQDANLTENQSANAENNDENTVLAKENDELSDLNHISIDLNGNEASNERSDGTSQQISQILLDSERTDNTMENSSDKQLLMSSTGKRMKRNSTKKKQMPQLQQHVNQAYESQNKDVTHYKPASPIVEEINEQRRNPTTEMVLGQQVNSAFENEETKEYNFGYTEHRETQVRFEMEEYEGGNTGNAIDDHGVTQSQQYVNIPIDLGESTTDLYSSQDVNSSRQLLSTVQENTVISARRKRRKKK